MPEEVWPQYENAMTKPLESLQQQIIHKAPNFELLDKRTSNSKAASGTQPAALPSSPYARAVFLRGSRLGSNRRGRPSPFLRTLSPKQKYIPLRPRLKPAS
jgi:hypothetical protein